MISRKLIKAIQKQINNCLKHYDYRALVAVSSQEYKYWVDREASYMYECWPINKEVWSVYKTKNETIISFQNGSSLRIARNCFKDYHVHNIVADKSLSNYIIDYVLKPMLIPYRYKRRRKILIKQIEE